jgi:antitoxin YefM
MAITASEARRRLFGLLQQVNDDAQSVEIISKNGTAHLVPDQEYRSLRELAHLCSSERNALRLFRSIAQAREGSVVRHELLTDDAAAAS